MSFLIKGFIQAEHMLRDELGKLKCWDHILLIRPNLLWKLPSLELS